MRFLLTIIYNPVTQGGKKTNYQPEPFLDLCLLTILISQSGELHLRKRKRIHGKQAC